MKGNTKKLTVSLSIVTIAMFIVAATTSAGQLFPLPNRHSIQGVYAITGSGNCFIAINGFNDKLQPNDGANGMWVWGPLTYDEAFITFNKDGTGSFTATVRLFDSWSPFFAGVPPDASPANEVWDFTYTVTGSGNFTITYVKGTYELDFTSGPNVGTPLGVSYIILPPVRGVVSPDQKILNLSFGTPDKMIFTSDKANNNPTPMQAICSVVFQGFWIGP